MAANRSEVWLHFEDAISGKAKCRSCGKQIACAGSSTSGLKKHLEGVHGIKVNVIAQQAAKKRKTNDATAIADIAVDPATISPPQTPKQSKIERFFDKETKQEKVAKLIALDGISARAIAKSDFIRQSFAEKGMVLPKSPDSLMNFLHAFFEVAKKEVIIEISNYKSQKLSCTIDEWTSIANRRYMNVNVHNIFGDAFNLGLIRIKMSCSHSVNVIK